MSDDSQHSKWQKFQEGQETQEQEQAAQQEAQEPEAAVEPIDNESSADDATVSAATDSAVEGELIALRLKVKELGEQVLRVEADKQNHALRTEREMKKARDFANQSLLKDLLPVLDSLNRGLQGLDTANEALAPMITGMEMTKELFEKTLTRSGISIINPEVGAVFDPALHEAMSMQPHPDMAANQVVQVLEQGYELNGRVLRAAMVIVSS